MSNIVLIEGWNVYDAESEPRIRDLDLAEKAALARPREIRSTIAKALADEVVQPAGGDRGPGNTAKVWIVKETTPGSVDPNQTADVYYLNEEAALLILMRLRTKTAIQVQRAVVRVFMLAKRGELPAVPSRPIAPALDAYREALGALGAAEAAGVMTPHQAAVRRLSLLRDATGINLFRHPPDAIESGPTLPALEPGESLIITKKRDTSGHYTATALGEPHGLSSTMVGKIARRVDVFGKSEFGMFRTFASDDGKTEFEHFLYSEAGKEALAPHLAAAGGPGTDRPS